MLNKGLNMNQILSDCSTSITELKRNPNALLEEADGMPIAILNHNKPIAYLVPADTYEIFLNLLEDKQLAKIIESRRNEHSKAIKVKFNDL